MGSRQAGHSVLFHRGSSWRRWSRPGPRGERWCLAVPLPQDRDRRRGPGGGGAGSRLSSAVDPGTGLSGGGVSGAGDGGEVPREYCWPGGQQVQPCTALPVLLQVVVLLGRFAWVPGNRYLPRTVEDADILPNEAAPDLRASLSRDQPLPGSARGQPTAPRRSWKQSLHVSWGERPLFSYPDIHPRPRPC